MLALWGEALDARCAALARRVGVLWASYHQTLPTVGGGGSLAPSVLGTWYVDRPRRVVYGPTANGALAPAQHVFAAMHELAHALAGFGPEADLVVGCQLALTRALVAPSEYVPEPTLLALLKATLRIPDEEIPRYSSLPLFSAVLRGYEVQQALGRCYAAGLVDRGGFPVYSRS